MTVVAQIAEGGTAALLFLILLGAVLALWLPKHDELAERDDLIPPYR